MNATEFLASASELYRSIGHLKDNAVEIIDYVDEYDFKESPFIKGGDCRVDGFYKIKGLISFRTSYGELICDDMEDIDLIEICFRLSEELLEG